MSKKQKINVLTTGGTIDKNYDEAEGILENSETLIQRFVLDKLRLPYTKVVLTNIMSKDSLLLNEDDRELIFQIIKSKAQEGNPILVVHGTDTMDKTAKYCFSKLKDISVPVVFTGSMRPIGFEDSDGRQNMTEALMALKLLGPGWYVSFHGRVFNVPKVKKNKSLGTFEVAKK